MKYCEDVIVQIEEDLKIGMNRIDTVSRAGISYETFTVWMEKPEFSERVKKAEIECKRRNIGIIQKAAIKTWQAAAWWLERKHRDEFALKTNYDNGIESFRVKAQNESISKITTETLEKIAENLSK